MKPVEQMRTCLRLRGTKPGCEQFEPGPNAWRQVREAQCRATRRRAGHGATQRGGTEAGRNHLSRAGPLVFDLQKEMSWITLWVQDARLSTLK